MEEFTVVAAQDFDAFYLDGKADEPRRTSDILVMSVDQKGIVMRKRDLRAATRKAAEETVHRTGALLYPGEKPNRKRMASVATVYDIEAHERSPEAIMGLSPDEGKGASPRPTKERV